MRINDICGVAGMQAEQDRKMQAFLADEDPTVPAPTEMARIAARLTSLQHDMTELASQVCLTAERALGPVPTSGVAAAKDQGASPSAVAFIDDLIDGINARLGIAFEAAQRLGRLV